MNYHQDNRSREETVGFEVHKTESIQIYPSIQPQPKIVSNCSEKLLPVEEGEDALSQIQGIRNSVQLFPGDFISPNHSENKGFHLENKFSLENFINQPYRIGSEITSEGIEKRSYWKRN